MADWKRRVRPAFAGCSPFLLTACCFFPGAGWAQTGGIGASISGDAPPAAPLAAEETALRLQIAAHPDSADLQYRLALMLRQANKPKESLETYTRAAQLRKPDAGELRSVALDPTDAEAWLILGSAQQDAGHWKEGRESYAQCVKQAKVGPVSECRMMLH